MTARYSCSRHNPNSGMTLTVASCVCFPNVTGFCENVSALMQEWSEALLPHGIIAVILSHLVAVLGLSVNTVFILAISRMIARKQIAWKSHGMLLSLAVGHLMFLSLTLFWGIIMQLRVTDGTFYGYWYTDTGYNVLFSLIYFSFANPFVNYTTASLLQLYAIRNPIGYRTLNPTKYILLVFLTWVVTSVCGAFNLMSYWLYKTMCLAAPGSICIPYNSNFAPSEHDPAAILPIGLFALFAVTIIACYCGVRYMISQRQRELSLINKTEIADEKRRVRSARRFMSRLGINVCIYATTLLLNTATGIYYYVKERQTFHELSSVWSPTMDLPLSEVSCRHVQRKEEIVQATNNELTIVMLVDVFLELRMVIEPAFHLLSNTKIRNFLLNQVTFGSKRTLSTHPTSEYLTRSNSSPYGSKDILNANTIRSPKQR